MVNNHIVIDKYTDVLRTQQKKNDTELEICLVLRFLIF